MFESRFGVRSAELLALLTDGCPGPVGCRLAELLDVLAVQAPCPQLWGVLDHARPDLLSVGEVASLTRVWDRAATWATARADVATLALAGAAGAERARIGVRSGPDGSPSRTFELDRPGREEVALALRVSPAAAEHRLQRAEDLFAAERFPVLAEDLLWGVSSPAHARALAEVTQGLPAGLCAEVELRVYETLVDGTPADVRRAARRAVASLQLDTPEPAPVVDPRLGRSVTRELTGDGQLAWIHALLPASDAAAVLARLDAAAALAAAAGDPRTADQVRADALAAFGWHGVSPFGPPAGAQQALDLSETGQTDPDTGPRAEPWGGPVPAAALTGRVLARLQVTTDLLTLLGLRALSGQVRGARGADLGLPGPAELRDLAADPLRCPDWQRFLHDPAGLLLGVSRAYRVPAALRATTAARYQVCTFPGCRRPAAGGDTDHVTPWRPEADRGGGTRLGNTHPPCRRHHNLKTHLGWRTTLHADGTLTWTSPGGQRATTHPWQYGPDPTWSPGTPRPAAPRLATSAADPADLGDPPF